MACWMKAGVSFGIRTPSRMFVNAPEPNRLTKLWLVQKMCCRKQKAKLAEAVI
jgi:hypothetical protein